MLPLTKLHGFSFLAGATTVTPSNEFDSFTLAVLRGRLVRYLMRSREVTCLIGLRDPLPTHTRSVIGKRDCLQVIEISKIRGLEEVQN